MSQQLQDQIKELATAVDAFKSTTERIDKLEKKVGHAPADLKAQQDAANEAISQIQAEMKEFKAAQARGSQSNDVDSKEQEKKLAKAYDSYMRKGDDSELKALSVDSDEDGGFLVSPQMSSEIIKKIFETSPMRMLASIQTISTDALEILEDLEESEVKETSETGSRTNTNTPKIKKIVIPVHELYAAPLATQKILDDSAINMESWLSEKVSEKMGRKENTWFVRGDGNEKAKGILAYPNGTGFGQLEQIETETSLAIKPDDLINLEYGVKQAYRRNGTFVAKREIVKLFRKFKDNEGRYMWEPGINGQGDETILGRKLVEFDDMDGLTANALVAGQFPVAFGDFKQGYQIVDRIGIRVIRDIYTKKPYIELYTTKRTGGGVKNFEAIKLMKVKA